MPYQSFPWQSGDSKSFIKLKQLALPSLAGKSVLDVGCNAGFFCGFARFSGADEVVGIDQNPDFIAMARTIFPDCRFLCQNWLEIGEGKYDIILLLSAIHYAGDQKALLDFLMSRLKPGGMLVLELGIAPGAGDAFVEVKRSIDTRFFPTRKKLDSMLADYAVKIIGRSVSQAGDPIERWVYHISNKAPVAILLMDDPHSGKTSISRHIFKSDIQYISGDVLYYEIMYGRHNPGHDIKAVVDEWTTDGRVVNCAAVTYHMGKNGLLPGFCGLVCQLAQGNDFLLDIYISRPFREEMRKTFAENGYFVVDVSLYGTQKGARYKADDNTEIFQQYEEYLRKKYFIDEQAYLAANPDVAEAVAKGQLANAREHYLYYGRQENRPLKPDNKN